MLAFLRRSILPKSCSGLRNVNRHGLRFDSTPLTRLQTGTNPKRMRVAVQGCGHGELNEIYASVEKACEVKGWDSIDLLIIGGDFQVGRTLLISKPNGYPGSITFPSNQRFLYCSFHNDLTWLGCAERR